MITQHRTWVVIPLIGLIVVTMACALPWAMGQAIKPTATTQPDKLAPLSISTSTVTPTPGLSASGSNGSTGGNTGGTSGNNGGTGGNNGGTGGSNGSTGGSTENTPTQLPEISAGPYEVKQIETLGGEVISGVVCSLTQPFGVLSNTPHVTFTFYFVPQNKQQGKVSYKYSIPSAGELHDAAGTYLLTPVDKGGTLQLSLAVSDHVVFKGFDGNIPNHYKFNLVPSDNTSCPSAP